MISLCLTTGGNPQALASLTFGDVEVPIHAICPFRDFLQTLLDVGAGSGHMDFDWNRNATCTYITKLHADKEFSVSPNRLVDVANSVTFVDGKCNMTDHGGATAKLSAEDIARLKPLLELEPLQQDKPNQPFVRLNPPSYNTSRITELYLEGMYKPVDSNIKQLTSFEETTYPNMLKAKVSNRRGGKVLLGVSGVLLGKTEADKLKMVEGAAAAMNSFQNHVGSGNELVNWWAVLADMGVFVKGDATVVKLRKLSRQ